MAQITSVTSEALQARVRTLLPSQQGFGEDLQASNVIMPVIDLTETASGSTLATNLQTALCFANEEFDVSNTTSTIVNDSGFFSVIGTVTSQNDAAVFDFMINDGASDKVIYGGTSNGSGFEGFAFTYSFVVFLRSQDTLKARTTDTLTELNGSTRQIATINGTLVNPIGFTIE